MELNRQAKFGLTGRIPVSGLAVIYFFKAEISSKICKIYVEHVKHVEKSYWKTDRTIDTKLNKFEDCFGS